MRWFLDTNVLLRLSDTNSPEHATASAAIESLIAREESVLISAQVLAEFWAVATRPVSANGLGWSTAAAAEGIRGLRGQFASLGEAPDALDRWLQLVDWFQVVGKHTHDARLAALLLSHGVRRLLTFNTEDFPLAWGVEATDPSSAHADSE